MKKDVDYLPMANTVAINHSGIRRDYAHLYDDAGCW
jgi:hypothetical protein